MQSCDILCEENCPKGVNELYRFKVYCGIAVNNYSMSVCVFARACVHACVCIHTYAWYMCDVQYACVYMGRRLVFVWLVNRCKVFERPCIVCHHCHVG